jgi:hypothetical protein
MITQSRSSRRTKVQPPKFDPFFEIGRRKVVLESLQPRLRRSLSNYETKVTSLSILFPPRKSTMNSSCGFDSTSGSTSSQASSASLIKIMYSHFNPIQSTTNPTKVTKKYDLFQFEEDENDNPWHVSYPLYLTPTTTLTKFKNNLPKFSSNGTILVNEHLIAFSNACHNIGVNDIDTCMRLFVNTLEGKDAVDFFELLCKVFMTWDELYFWFKSICGQPKS